MNIKQIINHLCTLIFLHKNHFYLKGTSEEAYDIDNEIDLTKENQLLFSSTTLLSSIRNLESLDFMSQTENTVKRE